MNRLSKQKRIRYLLILAILITIPFYCLGLALLRINRPEVVVTPTLEPGQPTATRTPTITLTPYQTGTFTNTPTVTLTLTPTHTATSTLTPTITPTPTETATPTLTQTPSPTPTDTPPPTRTPIGRDTSFDHLS